MHTYGLLGRPVWPPHTLFLPSTLARLSGIPLEVLSSPCQLLHSPYRLLLRACNSACEMVFDFVFVVSVVQLDYNPDA